MFSKAVLGKAVLGFAVLTVVSTTTTVLAELPEFSPWHLVPEDDVNLKCTDERVQEQCYPCTLGTPGNPKPHRYRREIRDMPQEQWDAFVFGLWEMKTLSMEEGQKKYGRAFKTYDFFPVFHAAVTQSVDGDQGHYGAVFIGFHAMFALMMEESLLAITKKAGLKFDGLPYWFSADDPSTLFARVGTHPGLGENYIINDGDFAYWPINNFDEQYWNQFMVDPALSPLTGVLGNNDGKLRSFLAPHNNDFLTAFPWTSDAGVVEPWEGFQYYDKYFACVTEPYSDTYTIFNFTACIDNVDLTPAGFQIEESWHVSGHWGLGGRGFFLPDGQYTYGDLAEPIGSPNSPMFVPLHLYFDFLVAEWKSQNADAVSETWGFPYERAWSYNPVPPFQGVKDGINANDVINSNWPITWADVGMAPYGTPKGERLVTNAEAACWSAKENAPYQYVRYSGAPAGHPGIDDPAKSNNSEDSEDSFSEDSEDSFSEDEEI